MPYAMIALAGLQLTGSYFASQNVKDSARLNKDIADMNAQFAELDAYDAEIEGYSQTARYQAVIDKTLGEQRAVLAAADVDLSYGSVASIEQDTRFIADINKMEIHKQAQERALGFKSQARQYTMSGQLGYAQSKVQSSAIMTQGILGAAQTLAPLGSSGYRDYMKGKNNADSDTKTPTT